MSFKVEVFVREPRDRRIFPDSSCLKIQIVIFNIKRYSYLGIINLLYKILKDFKKLLIKLNSNKSMYFNICYNSNRFEAT